MRLNYFIIPLITVAVAAAGSYFTGSGMDWYKTIKLEPWTPSGAVIGSVWTTIFILTAASALIVWNRATGGGRMRLVAAAFAVNAVLNVLWSLLFFRLHLMGAAALEAAFLGASVVLLGVLIWPISRPAAILLVPYAGWVFFATYVAYATWLLNR